MRNTLAFCLLALTCSLSLCADTLRQNFVTPPDNTKPYMYWYWLNNNASAKGITADLEAMRQAGIGEVFIGHVVSDGIPEGAVPILSPEWWRLVAHAVSEGDRLGVRVSMFNGPGWSQSGGPWMKPEQSMRYLVSAETLVTGGQTFRGVPPKHAKAIQDVALIAYPVPQRDAGTVRPARVGTEPKNDSLAALLTSGSGECDLPLAPLTIELEFAAAATFQTLTLDFGDSPVRLEGVLESVRNGAATKLRDLALFRTNLSTAMGPFVAAPFTFSFAPTETDRLRITFTRLEGKPVVRDIACSCAARIDFGVEKQLGRMYAEPVPPVDAFLWPRLSEPVAGTAVEAARIVDLTGKTSKDGALAWQAPAGGDWLIARIGMASTGVKCGPTPPQAQGLECDKMSRAAVDTHFDGMIGEFLRRVPADQRKGFTHITLDSYEVGPQNWTDGMTGIFEKTYGYDPTPWLACLSGRVIGSRDQTDRFLWDWRRLVADRVARNYVGGLKAVANRHGLKTWLENYGHWGFPGESLQYGGASDDIGGEYWLWNTLGDVECRLATSTAHVYGKKVVSAESFTSGKNFVQTPANMKTRGDWCMTQGINHFVLHVYTHQPYDATPGIVPWFGTDFNRNSTWFQAYGKGWTDYLRRCCFLLQQGTHEADVAYFFGEDTPRMNGLKDPPLPQGYDYDYINAEVLLTRATCRNGRLTLPDGQSYRVLVLPPSETMTPRLLERIASFVKQGLVLVGNPPQRSPSLSGFPGCDGKVLEASRSLWGADPAAALDNPVRKGRVFKGHTLDQVFGKLAVPPDLACVSKDVLWIHRTSKDADIYFVSNQSEKPLAITPEFRVTGKQPELWDAVSGATCETALFETLPHATRVPLRLDPAGSVFVVFRKPLATSRMPVRSLALNGETVVSCEQEKAPDADPVQPGTFAITALVKPGKTIALPQQSPRGVSHQDQNFVVFPTHGKTWGEGHSGAGLSVGKNGVAAFEHWHQNIAPVLVWQAPAPLDKPVHVALIYTAGVPSLFIDGKKVHTGVASGQTPHLSLPVGDAFIGQSDGVTCLPGALVEADLAAAAARALAAAAAGDRPLPSLTFDAAGALTLTAGAPGQYVAVWPDGVKRAWQVSEKPFSLSLDNTVWTVTFQQGADAGPHTVFFDTLSDWKDSSDPYVKYYSGSALYSGRFCWARPRPDARVLLDLGDVRQIASVTVNGKAFGVVWKKPFRVDITDALRSGENELQVSVANEWFNRFIGDEQLPDDTGANAQGEITAWPDWVLKGEKRPEPRRATLVTRKQVAKDTPLHASGLLGPVTVFEEFQVK